jgi:hypothetical protein
MDKYIGIDVHVRSCTLAVVDGVGKRVSQQVVETNGASLVECLRMIPGVRHLCIEEGRRARGCTRSCCRTFRSWWS